MSRICDESEEYRLIIKNVYANLFIPEWFLCLPF